eukprot:3533572-Rhodomonas_salina.2
MSALELAYKATTRLAHGRTRGQRRRRSRGGRPRLEKEAETASPCSATEIRAPVLAHPSQHVVLQNKPGGRNWLRVVSQPRAALAPHSLWKLPVPGRRYNGPSTGQVEDEVQALAFALSSLRLGSDAGSKLVARSLACGDNRCSSSSSCAAADLACPSDPVMAQLHIGPSAHVPFAACVGATAGSFFLGRVAALARRQHQVVTTVPCVFFGIMAEEGFAPAV